jgi:Putative amidase domain
LEIFRLRWTGPNSAEVEISYWFTSQVPGQESVRSGVTDLHTITFAQQRGAVVVTDDRLLAADSAEPATSPKVPGLVAALDTRAPVDRVAADRAEAVAKVGDRTTNPMERITITSMVHYALLWTNEEHKNRYNPNFPTGFINHCANFVSQSLWAGGWKFRSHRYNGFYCNEDLKSWTRDLPGPDLKRVGGHSNTFTVAHDLLFFAAENTNVPWLKNVDDARPGDMMWADWEPKTGPLDGKMDHAFLVTGAQKDGGGQIEPYISQKSPNRHNISWNLYNIYRVKGGNKQVDWYGLVTSSYHTG